MDGLLSVSTTGHVYRVLDSGELRELPQHGTSRNLRYRCVRPSINGKQKSLYVHRLVAEAFIPNPHNFPQVNHIDGNPENNNVSNLEWCSASHNIKHAYETGLINHYRNSRICASCGCNISDQNKTNLCGKCLSKLQNTERYNHNVVLFGVIEFNKKVLGISNAMLAEMTGYSKETIDCFMCGKRVSRNVAIAICEVLDINKALVSFG